MKKILDVYPGFFSTYHKAHAIKNPSIARTRPRCKKKLLSPIHPEIGENWSKKLNIISINPSNGSNPFR